MASKRAMYKPAQSENVGRKGNRTPLAQGRLIKEKVDGPSNVKSNSENIGIILRPQTVPLIPSRNTSGHLEPGLTPRSLAPRLTENRSSHLSSRTTTLDLTNSDEEVSFKYNGRQPPNVFVHGAVPDVLVLDASRQTKNPNGTEVDVVTSYIRSPAKIVCHSPAAVHRQMRVSGDVPIARRVVVDKVPNRSILSELVEEQRQRHEDLTGEQSITGSHVDPHTAVELVPNRSPLQRPIIAKPVAMPVFLQPNFEDSQDSDRSDRSIKHVPSMPENLDSESDACSIQELMSKSTTQKGVAKSTSKRQMSSVKKKRGRIVQSRYLQNVTSFRATSPELSINENLRLNKTRQTSKSMDMTPSARKLKSKRFRNTFVEPMQTPMQPPSTGTHSRQSTSKKTSTPTGMLDASLIPPGMDASAIMPHDASAAVEPERSIVIDHPKSGRKKLVDKTSRQHDSAIQSKYSSSSVTPATPLAKSKQEQITQKNLDLLYGRYVQSLFFESKMRKVNIEQEKLATAQLSALWEKNEELAQKKFEMDAELCRLKHANMVDKQTETLNNSLTPVVNSLSNLEKNYKTLSHALDTTRHQIPTKGIHIPANEDEYQENLIQALLESEQLLGQISVLSRKQQPNVISSASALDTFEKTLQKECEFLRGCIGPLAAMESLTIKESSLRLDRHHLTR